MSKSGLRSATFVFLSYSLVSLWSSQSFAQLTPKLNVDLLLKPNELEGQFGRRTATVLPITLKVTHLINQEQFDTLSIEDLKVSLYRLNTLRAEDMAEDERFNIGLGGELLSFRNRMVIAPDAYHDATQRQFLSFNLVSLKGVGLMKINQDVFLQLNAFVETGPQIKSNLPIYEATYEQEYEMLSTYCSSGFPYFQDAQPWTTSGKFATTRGTELTLTVRKLDVSFFSEKLSAKGDHPITTSFEKKVDPWNSGEDAFTHRRKFSQNTSGIRCNYRFNDHVAVYAGLKVFNSSLESFAIEKKYRYRNGSERIYTDQTKDPVNTLGEFSHFKVQMLEVGIRISPSKLFKKQKPPQGETESE